MKSEKSNSTFSWGIVTRDLFELVQWWVPQAVALIMNQTSIYLNRPSFP